MDTFELDLNIYTLWYEPFLKKSFITVIIIVFALVLGILIFFFKTKKKKIKKLSVDDILIKLHSLNKQIKNEQFVEFYNDLIFLIKQFIFVNYGYDYFSKTEEELLIFLKTEKLDLGLIEEIKILMNNASIIKFSGAQMQKLHMEKDLGKCIDLINILKKPVEQKI